MLGDFWKHKVLRVKLYFRLSMDYHYNNCSIRNITSHTGNQSCIKFICLYVEDKPLSLFVDLCQYLKSLELELVIQ